MSRPACTGSARSSSTIATVSLRDWTRFTADCDRFAHHRTAVCHDVGCLYLDHGVELWNHYVRSSSDNGRTQHSKLTP